MAYDNAVEIVHALAGHKLNHDQDDYLAIISSLVEDYENKNVPKPRPVSGIEPHQQRATPREIAVVALPKSGSSFPWFGRPMR